jgi:cellulose synthase/poly-beta-1,6-N-acetylglucosamine synthase-like glycosyltransferase
MALPPRILFLVPAHNEELLISECVNSLQQMDYPAMRRRVIVIADNCVDNTAGRAESAGVEAWVRDDQVKRGKSEAIGWAIANVDLALWEAIVILDADSTVDPGFASALAAQAPLEQKVVQAYFGSSNEFETWLTRLSGVLTRIRYEIAYPSKQARLLNVPLTGNGMCIGAELLSAEGWRADSITENWELYARWTASGVRICYCREARLFSQESGSLRQGRSQRLRWASGRAEVFRKWRGPILRSRVIGPRQKLDAIWTLGAPSPVVGATLALLLSISGLLTLRHPYSLILAAVVMATLLPWLGASARILWTHPQKMRTLLSFVMLPPYALWRAVVQVRAVVVGTRDGWIRTARR